MPGLADSLYDSACADALSDAALIAAMLRFEAALARSCARIGLAAAAEADAVERACREFEVDPGWLGREARQAGTFAIPLLRGLTARVAATAPAATRWVHYGATSQDLIDTATVLCVREAAGRIGALLQRLGDAVAQLAARHARTPVLSRTLLQAAAPVPFGWKAAVWLAPLARARQAWPSAQRAACTLQFGGANGTLSALGDRGEALAAALAGELALDQPPITWHGARDGFARLGSEAAILTGAAGKVARDVALLMQGEVGEAREPSVAGRGGSSAMPHKRNPAGCTSALEAAQRAPQLAATLLSALAPEHERGLGQWQGQWLTLRELLASCAGALASMGEVIDGLVVDEAAMCANIERALGWVHSEAVALRLGERLGRERAQSELERLSREGIAQGRSLAEALRGDAALSALLSEPELARLCAPEAAFEPAGRMIERTLALWREAE